MSSSLLDVAVVSPSQDNIFQLIPPYLLFSMTIKASIHSHIPEIYFISRFIVCKVAIPMNIVKNYPFSINSCFLSFICPNLAIKIIFRGKAVICFTPQTSRTATVRENIHPSPNGNSLKADILCTCGHLLPRHP